ncbi:MAG TPA: hypothetical protein VGR76_21925 [Candidatus Angelobacter sp.]|jgi:hypothetical protein|nr:hypothetical protein [Candidatus Angelobacter sp.]
MKMQMKAKLFLSAAAMVAFMASPAFAQHGHGGGGMGSSASMHGSDHSSSTHGSSDDHSGHSSTQSSISTRLSSNTKLASKLQSLLPPGTDLQAAASGFKNLGQFVAAVHVSHNLGIPFDQLKAKMQGPPTESLGKAIHELKPDADAKAQTKTAETEAHQDMDNDSK